MSVRYCQPPDLKFFKGSLEEMSVYQFGPRIIKHYFCPICGSNILEKWPADGEYGLNLRCVEGVELAALKIHEYDGRSK